MHNYNNEVSQSTNTDSDIDEQIFMPQNMNITRNI